MKDNQALQGGQDNAMTEIALALAMGFFSLMVLTLVSMGNGATPEEKPGARFDGLRIVASQPNPAGSTAAEPDDTFIIFDGSDFFDQDMRGIDPATVMPLPGRRIVLAVPPDSPLTHIIAARARIKAENVVIADLDRDWIAAIASWRAPE